MLAIAVGRHSRCCLPLSALIKVLKVLKVLKVVKVVTRGRATRALLGATTIKR